MERQEAKAIMGLSQQDRLWQGDFFTGAHVAK
jgi:hypothetical protein